MGEQYQVFITVNETGEIMTCEVGQFIVRNEPADFFFMVDEETGKDLQVNAQYYKVVLVGFKPSLQKEEPPVEEPVEDPATDEPTDETPVEEPTNPTE